MITGKRHGDLARWIADDIRSQRRLTLGLDQPPLTPVVLPNTSPEDKRRRKLEGGTVIVGRPTFKEFMAGLKRGWTDGLEIVDREEQLAGILESDGKFDEPELEPQTDGPDVEGEPIPTVSRLPQSKSVSPFTPPHLRVPQPSSSSTKESSLITTTTTTPPANIPLQPPLLLVTFVDHLGFMQIPHMIWGFFNQRNKVRAGAEAAYRLIMGEARPFTAPPAENLEQSAEMADPTTFSARPHLSEVPATDLDFDRDAESYYKKSTVRSFASEIEKARVDYYASLPARLETARAIARGTRKATKEEINNPPPTEVELRAERMKKELRWRADEEGWNIVKPEANVEWDERFRTVLKVFIDPPSGPGFRDEGGNKQKS